MDLMLNGMMGAVDAAAAAVQRAFLELSGTQTITLSDPVEFTGNHYLEVEFALTHSNNVELMSSTVDSARFYIHGGNVKLTVTPDNTTFFSFDIPVSYKNGKQHAVRIQQNGADVDYYMDGSLLGTRENFDITGVAWNQIGLNHNSSVHMVGTLIKVTTRDLVNTALSHVNNQTHNFSSKSTTKEAAEEGTLSPEYKVVTYTDVDAGDWWDAVWDESNQGWVDVDEKYLGTMVSGVAVTHTDIVNGFNILHSNQNAISNNWIGFDLDTLISGNLLITFASFENVPELTLTHYYSGLDYEPIPSGSYTVIDGINKMILPCRKAGIARQAISTSIASLSDVDITGISVKRILQVA